MNKKELPDIMFKKFLAENIVSEYCDNIKSLDNELYNREGYLLYYYFTKDQIEEMFRLCESERLPSFPSIKEKFYKCGDLDESAIPIINYLSFVIDTSIKENVIDIPTAFEYYKRILSLFVYYHKYILFTKWITIDEGKITISKTERTAIWRGDWYDENYYSVVPSLFSKYFNNNTDYCKYTEDFIDKHFNYFCGYNECWLTGLRSNIYLLDPWVTYFNFSDEFMSKHTENLYLPSLLKNKYYTESKERTKFLFANVLESNINDVIETYSLGVENPKIKIPPEKIDEYLLMYIVNA